MTTAYINAGYWIGAVAFAGWLVVRTRSSSSSVAAAFGRNGVEYGWRSRLFLAAFGGLLWPVFLLLDLFLPREDQ